MQMRELLRRDVIRLIGFGDAGMLVMPGSTLPQSKTTFRMDEQNSIHFLADLPKYIDYSFLEKSYGKTKSCPWLLCLI
jgi:hypothetical protein